MIEKRLLKKYLLNFFKKNCFAIFSFENEGIVSGHFSFFSLNLETQDQGVLICPQKKLPHFSESFQMLKNISLVLYKEEVNSDDMEFVQIQGEAILFTKNDFLDLKKNKNFFFQMAPILGFEFKNKLKEYHLLKVFIHKLDYNILSLLKEGHNGVSLKKVSPKKNKA